jgi:hypothetical protein
MGEAFILRKGGGGGTQAIPPTITIVEIGFTNVIFNITNNDSESGIILYELGDPTPDEVKIELAGGATSDNIEIINLSEDTTYNLYSWITITGKVQSETTIKEFQTNFIELGLIAMWYGTAETVPTGWQLCNGTNGSPDLRNRFVMGNGSTYTIGQTGGSANAVLLTHTHTASTSASGAHTHSIKIGSYGGTTGAGGRTATGDTWTNHSTGGAGSHTHTHTYSIASSGSSATNANLPPYRALFYIIKVPSGGA